ncbi:hypothetical protein MUN82_10430 [Hymenobacter aerilatus]|uniref:DUF7033 domain-containing protein n=1 Tax=Hymenobacter aerilatus TaxID=2932251 RepID=A0A8T9T1G4_9BACT|nr:hypothetical protein [Hymenobacter aerilatus]UOR07491.1 hypothetical protein MUN82_10430 [Hymenobacter aerilatus]
MPTAPTWPLSYAVPTSDEARIAYVLRHLRMAYPTLPDIRIGYAGTHPQLVVQEASNGFFEQQQPYPIAPNYRKWLGRQIPFFFDPHPEKPLLELLPDGRAVIHADIISAAFYLLSGWQEYYSEERDLHGRFPYAASVQKQYDFVTIPVVNYYFDVLKIAVEHVTGHSVPPRRWSGAPFAACITHDVDNLYSAWKAPAKAALQRRDWLGFGRQLWRHFTQKDAWNNLEEVQQAVASYGAKSTFFFLTEHRKAPDGTPNADYRLPRIWPRLAARLHNAEIGLHASLGTATHAGRLSLDWQQLPPRTGAIRFHYLSWEPRITPTFLSTYNFDYDSTLGFAEHFGFRNSYCLPFYPFNFTADSFEHDPPQIKLFSVGSQPHDYTTLNSKNSIQTSRFLEIPLNVMDTTLHHPRYLQLAPDEVLPALLPMLLEIEMFGGVCTVLWHNQNFDPANTYNGPRQFHDLMRYLRSRNAAFLTGTEVSSEMKK